MIGRLDYFDQKPEGTLEKLNQVPTERHRELWPNNWYAAQFLQDACGGVEILNEIGYMVQNIHPFLQYARNRTLCALWRDEFITEATRADSKLCEHSDLGFLKHFGPAVDAERSHDKITTFSKVVDHNSDVIELY